MGGHMTFSRFRHRNGLDVRPNYFTDSVPAATTEGLLSGELDRMVHGLWMNPDFQRALAERVGISLMEVGFLLHVLAHEDYNAGESGTFWHCAHCTQGHQ